MTAEAIVQAAAGIHGATCVRVMQVNRHRPHAKGIPWAMLSELGKVQRIQQSQRVLRKMGV